MKKIICLILLAVSFNSFADCKSAYALKAYKRAMSNSTIKTTAVYVGVAGGTAAVAPVIFGGGAAASVGALVVGGVFVGAGFEPEDYRLVKPTDKNTYYKVLRAIKSAEKNEVSEELTEALDRKISLSLRGEAEQTEIHQKVIQQIREMNQNETLCRSENNKVKLMNFRSLVNRLVEEI